MLVIHDREAVLDARVSVAQPAEGGAPGAVAGLGADAISLSVHDNLAAVEPLWRAFEATADCTAFQSFAWHAAWQTHIGDRRAVTPAIVVGHHAGRVLFILPLALKSGRLARRLCWHAADLCDYNAPLLAPDFSAHVLAGGFVGLWQAVAAHLKADPRFRHDVVALQRMPERVGAQRNPFLDLPVSLNPSGAYMMAIAGTWDEFYRDKRSSATRRHDRSKRKRLAEFGPVSMVTATEPCELERTLDALFAQKAATFAARGVPNFLARPGTRDFYRAVAADPSLRDIVHVSRLQVGAEAAAANLGLVFRGRYYHVVASYDGGPISRFGPGTTHLHELIAYALQRGCREFDFTVGDEAYKRDWCDTEVSLHDHRAAASLRGAVVSRTAAAANRLKRLVKQTPALWRTFMQARLVMARLKGNTSGAGAEPAANKRYNAAENE